MAIADVWTSANSGDGYYHDNGFQPMDTTTWPPPKTTTITIQPDTSRFEEEMKKIPLKRDEEEIFTAPEDGGQALIWDEVDPMEWVKWGAVTREDVRKALHILGLNPHDVRGMEMHPTMIEVEEVVRDSEGKAMLRNNDLMTRLRTYHITE